MRSGPIGDVGEQKGAAGETWAIISSMLARGHVLRRPHAQDGRAHDIRLTRERPGCVHKANATWNAGLGHLESSLSMPVKEVRRALHSIDDAAATLL